MTGFSSSGRGTRAIAPLTWGDSVGSLGAAWKMGFSMWAVMLGIWTYCWVLQSCYGPVKTWISLWLLKRQKTRLRERMESDLKRPLVLIVAAKGAPDAFGHFLELVTGQNYPDYRIVFVTESEDDPARLAIVQFLGINECMNSWEAKPGAIGAKSVELVVAGLSANEGQKVHNQLAAFKRLRESDEIVAFADADIMGSVDWLARLVGPLNSGDAELSTGYRWFVPENNSIVNMVASNINTGVAMLTGPSWHTLLWGGSMAMNRATFDELDVPKCLKGCLNDDLQLSRIAHAAGKRLHFVRNLMALSPVNYTWKSLLHFGQRQYFQVLIYVPKYWWAAFVLTSLWLSGFGITLTRIILGDLKALIPMAIVWGTFLLTFVSRPSYLKAQFSPDVVKKLLPSRMFGLFTGPFGYALHWFIVLSAAPVREITWAGIRYRVKGRQELEVLDRSG